MMFPYLKPVMTPKISDLFTKYFEKVKSNGTIPGIDRSQTIDQNAIDKCALSFLTDNIGDLKLNITDDDNLNRDITDMFAQTFIRDFWNVPIGYEDEMSFWFRFKAFLDENLPVWAQFYKKAIIDKELMYTNISSVSVDNNGVLHVESGSKNSARGNTNSENNNSVDGTSGVINGSKNTSTVKTDSSNNVDENGNHQQLDANANTPQNQLRGNVGELGTFDDPLSGYSFDYASNVNGTNSKDKKGTKQTGNVTETHDDNGNVTISNTNNQNTTDKNSTSNKNVNSLSSTSDQTNGNSVRQDSSARNDSLFNIAREISNLNNGAYSGLFNKMKYDGLFLGSYYQI